ncbi:MAG: energy transducer TonB [Deltaproteobacteria bacterium]|jgi:protein TonB|nr:energy transducer TonB [Deltaproteobacteria bacterium]
MSKLEKKALFRSSFMSAFIHMSVLVFMVAYGSAEHKPPPREMLVVLSEFDPLGGNPGGMAGLEESVIPLIPHEVPQEAEPEEESVIEPQIIDEVALIESENGEIMPEIFEEPPLEEVVREPPKPKPKPKPQPKPQAAPAQATQVADNAGNHAPSAGQTTGSGQGGFGGGTGQGSRKMLDSYISKVRNRMDRNKKYPNRAESKNGVVEINFTILADGAVTGAKIVTSSGHSALDDEVMALVRRVTPFAPIPPEIGRDRLNLTVPVVFSRR